MAEETAAEFGACGTAGNPCPGHDFPAEKAWATHDENGIGWVRYNGPPTALSFLDGIEMTDAERLAELVGLYERRLREEGLEVER